MLWTRNIWGMKTTFTTASGHKNIVIVTGRWRCSGQMSKLWEGGWVLLEVNVGLAVVMLHGLLVPQVELLVA